MEPHEQPATNQDRGPKPKKGGRKARGVFWRDGEWWIRWACTLGHDHRQPSGELKTAATEEHKAKRAGVREARKAGRECCPRLVARNRLPVFEEILSDYMEHSRRTKRSTDDDKPKERRFKALFAGRLASDIMSKEVEDFKASFLEEKLKGKAEAETWQRTPATVNHYLKFLKAVFNRAVKHGRLTYNPVRAVKLYRENNARNRCLTAEEEARLMEKLPARLRPFVTVALHTGMRRGELRALKWEHVDFATGTIHIPQDKAGDGRWVTMNSVAREALLSVKREQKVLSPTSSAHLPDASCGIGSASGDRLWRPLTCLISASTTADIPSPPGSRWRAWISTRSSWPAGGRHKSWSSATRT